MPALSCNRWGRLVAFLVLLPVLSCGSPTTKGSRDGVLGVRSTVRAHRVPVDAVSLGDAWRAAIAAANAKKVLETELFVQVESKARAGRPRIASASAVRPAPSIESVLACIKAHESGDYTEHSHPNGSTGAYQYEPGTWRAWSERAGYPGWPAAYLAPPAVQDAVTAYALTHGGAGNWSTRWGNDPCTAGLPGGG